MSHWLDSTFSIKLSSLKSISYPQEILGFAEVFCFCHWLTQWKWGNWLNLLSSMVPWIGIPKKFVGFLMVFSVKKRLTHTQKVQYLWQFKGMGIMWTLSENPIIEQLYDWPIYLSESHHPLYQAPQLHGPNGMWKFPTQPWFRLGGV